MAGVANGTGKMEWDRDVDDVVLAKVALPPFVRRIPRYTNGSQAPTGNADTLHSRQHFHQDLHPLLVPADLSEPANTHLRDDRLPGRHEPRLHLRRRLPVQPHRKTMEPGEPTETVLFSAAGVLVRRLRGLRRDRSVDHGFAGADHLRYVWLWVIVRVVTDCCSCCEGLQLPRKKKVFIMGLFCLGIL